MNKISKDPQKFIDDPNLWEQMPSKAVWPADNYNHLHEQPVIFYAFMFYIVSVGQSDPLYMYLAWAYVGVRVVHSFVQATSNRVMARFSLFAIGSIILMVMTGRAVLGAL